MSAEQAAAALAGRGIVVTRPREQAPALAKRIAAAGGSAQVYPTIEIAEPLDRRAVLHIVQGLHEADLAVFVSPTAARAAMRLVRAHSAWPAALSAAAVGPGTRRELEALGIARILAPLRGADSEALLAMGELQRMDGRKVVIFRGEGGRDVLGAALRARGAAVRYAECYRRVTPQTDIAPLLALWERGAIDAVTAFSAQALAGLFALVGEAGAPRLKETPLFVSHERIAQDAAGRGVKRIVVAGPGDEEMVAGLVAYFMRAK